ncbi:hypothetical protein I6E10_05650, partial [Phocaeicola barnesiae]|nr:hypothetical protein [Phocaeicola barnesiae]
LKEDQLAVEAVLNLRQYNRTDKKKVEKLLEKKQTYQDWDDLTSTRQEIIDTLGEK